VPNIEHTCEFCGKYDPQLVDDNYRDIHLFNACPMLILCECQQAIEVSSLSSHLLSECKNSKYYKRCPRCKEAIHQRNYRAHTEAKECNPAKPMAANNRCPLCH
jgi:centrosomal protein CEP104